MPPFKGEFKHPGCTPLHSHSFAVMLLYDALLLAMIMLADFVRMLFS
jgi:hypothetical protein